MINENKIKISGVANLSDPPKRTNIFVDLSIKDATLTGDKDIRSNEDDTEDVYYKIKITPETHISILAENDILTAKKKGSKSQVLRNAIRAYWEQQCQGDIDFDGFYELEMTNLIQSYKDKLL